MFWREKSEKLMTNRLDRSKEKDIYLTISVKDKGDLYIERNILVPLLI